MGISFWPVSGDWIDGRSIRNQLGKDYSVLEYSGSGSGEGWRERTGVQTSVA